MTADDQALLREQQAYYQARAPEYDEWWRRTGRYDRGPEWKRRWDHDVTVVRDALDAFYPTGDALELACGTGWWTRELIRHATSVTAVDGSPAAITINRAAVDSPRVQYIEADLFTWMPDRQYDVVFFGFWLSHVPPDRFQSFWDRVRTALRPTGRVFFVDSGAQDPLRSRERDRAAHDILSPRRLRDGRAFTVVKVLYDADDLERRLREVGWDVSVQPTHDFFVYGFGQPA